MINLRTLRWECYPGLSMYAQRNHKGLYMREGGGSESEREIVVEGGAIAGTGRLAKDVDSL